MISFLLKKLMTRLRNFAQREENFSGGGEFRFPSLKFSFSLFPFRFQFYENSPFIGSKKEDGRT